MWRLALRPRCVLSFDRALVEASSAAPRGCQDSLLLPRSLSAAAMSGHRVVGLWAVSFLCLLGMVWEWHDLFGHGIETGQSPCGGKPAQCIVDASTKGQSLDSHVFSTSRIAHSVIHWLFRMSSADGRSPGLNFKMALIISQNA